MHHTHGKSAAARAHITQIRAGRGAFVAWDASCPKSAHVCTRLTGHSLGCTCMGGCCCMHTDITIMQEASPHTPRMLVARARTWAAYPHVYESYLDLQYVFFFQPTSY